MRSPTVCLSQGQVLVHLQAPEYECTDPAFPPGVQADPDRPEGRRCGRTRPTRSDELIRTDQEADRGRGRLPPGVQADRDRAPDEVLGSGRSPRRSCRWRSRSMAVLISSSPRSAREDDHGALLIRRENGTCWP